VEEESHTSHSNPLISNVNSSRREVPPLTSMPVARVGLLLAVAGLAIVVLIVRTRVATRQASLPLRLSDSVQLSAPPPLQSGDLEALKTRLAALDPLKQRARPGSRDTNALAELGAAALDAGDNFTARSALASIERPELASNPVLRDALGSCLTSLAQFDEAAQVYRAYVRRNPSDLTGYLGLSSALLALGRRTESAAAMESASAALSPNDIGSRLKLSAAFDERTETPLALAEANKALAAAPSDPGVLISVARLQYKLSHPREARDLAVRALRLAPENGIAHRLLGDLAADTLVPGSDPAVAEDQYLRALQYAPGDTKSLEALATLLLSQRRYRQAAYIALTWVSAAPSSGSARMLLARALQGLGDVNSSKQQSLALGLLAAERKVGQMSAFRSQRPRDAHVRVQLAQALRESGRLSAALQEAQAAFCLSPESPDARAELTAIYGSVGIPMPPPTQPKFPTDWLDALR
jgi:tetratricopeptide (TPR) repeat protein